jgi:hypothetical protein
MCCGDYIGDDEDGRARMRVAVSDKALIAKISVGQQATFKIKGEVQSVTAPKMVTDYDKPYDYKKGTKRPMKEKPGEVTLRLDKGDPDIELLRTNAALMSEEG